VSRGDPSVPCADIQPQTLALCVADGIKRSLANLATYMMITHVVPILAQDGVCITSTATPALDATYAIDPSSQAPITAPSTGIAAGKPVPGGGSTFNYLDLAGAQHAFNGTNFCRSPRPVKISL
jgi:hypothetical protein